jgi:hypothetical protein
VAEAQFTILKYRDKIPILAVCPLCNLKFLTPHDMMKDAESAELYLRTKYQQHNCKQSAAPRKWHS